MNEDEELKEEAPAMLMPMDPFQLKTCDCISSLSAHIFEKDMYFMETSEVLFGDDEEQSQNIFCTIINDRRKPFYILTDGTHTNIEKRIGGIEDLEFNMGIVVNDFANDVNVSNETAKRKFAVEIYRFRRKWDETSLELKRLIDSIGEHTPDMNIWMNRLKIHQLVLMMEYLWVLSSKQCIEEIVGFITPEDILLMKFIILQYEIPDLRLGAYLPVAPKMFQSCFLPMFSDNVKCFSFYLFVQPTQKNRDMLG
ncbi:MAG: hypothetical protein GY714_14820 [Desulfobacterales bacterium]|nr:hypothetical protein [Desulfobacterales bacterium]